MEKLNNPCEECEYKYEDCNHDCEPDDIVSAMVYQALIERDREWVKSVEPIINKLLEIIDQGDYSNGNVSQGVDEGRYQIYRCVTGVKMEWQTLQD